jgi:hypothetical protein
MRIPVLFLLLISKSTFCQSWDNEIICSPNPIVIERPGMKFDRDSTTKFLAFICKKRSKVAFRMEVGISRYYYNKSTANWLGNHGGPNFNFFLEYDKINVGMKFKPWTVNPRETLNFNGSSLSEIAKLNPIKIDFTVGYSLNSEPNISFEPFLGYTRSSFQVINEDVLQQQYSIPKTGGFLVGLTINKYIKLKNYENVSIFGNAEYCFVDFSKVHPTLTQGYFEWTLGLAFKNFFPKYFYKTVEAPKRPDRTI